MKQTPKAFIFDLDGVITDTAEFHYLAWKKLAEELGITIDREFNEQLKGVSRMDSLERILALNPSLINMPQEEKEKLAFQKNEHYMELITTIKPENILPGIEELFINLKENHIKIAIGSASKNAQRVLELLGLTHYIDYIVDAAKVTKGKPDPETFTTAADYLNIPYGECVGLEDAAAGVQAINQAGMFSVGIGDKEHLSAANYIVSDTTLLDLDDILKQFNLR
jgi:beta-phosphoglucomutase